MIIKRIDNKFGSNGCYKCKRRIARWKFIISMSKKYDLDTGKLTVLLCNDCARLHEDQLRTFFLG